jgi:hypothetical protein
MRRSSRTQKRPRPVHRGQARSLMILFVYCRNQFPNRRGIGFFSAVAADPCPKHPAGRRFPPPGGFRREPPVPDFAASHLAGSGFMMVWARRSRKCSLRVSEIPGPFPQCGGLLPRGGYLPLAGSRSDRANPFAFRPSSSRAYRATPFAGYVHFWPIGVYLHLALSRVVTFSSFPGSQRGLCGHSRPPRRRLSINAIGSVLAFWRSGFLPVPAFLLGRLDSPGMGYGIRDGASSC